MANTPGLRELREWLNDSRKVNLAGFLVVNDAIKDLEAKSRQQLVTVLRNSDEFRNPTAFEEHRAE